MLIFKIFCFQEKIDSIHEAVIRGNIRETRGHLDKRGWANARDHYGHSPLHKSVMANQEEIMKFIIRLYPDHVEDRDNVSSLLFRIPYLYDMEFSIFLYFLPKLPGHFRVAKFVICYCNSSAKMAIRAKFW